MSRKVFISFLGAGTYKECCYISKEKGKSEIVKYVQAAIIDLYCDNFSKEDVVYIFLTKGAKYKNWDGLKSELDKRVIKYEPIYDLPNGYSEEEIWNIFEIIFNILQKDDSIIFDITHSFRSLPMLGIVLLRYAKALKNVTVNKILYGAFEALGPVHSIEDSIPNPLERKAPLIDLTTFSTIQSWTFGAETFVKTGSAELIKDLTMQDITPILANTQGKSPTEANLRDLVKSLNSIDNLIKTNRGRTISESNIFKRAFDPLKYLTEQSQTVLPPLKLLLNQIENKLSDFQEMPNWEASVQWCIDHNLIQEAITQLQEGIVTMLCDQHQLASSNEENRTIVTSAFNILAQEIDESKWNETSSSNKEKVKEIISSSFVERYATSFTELQSLRNDINHGGYKENSKSKGEGFKTQIDRLFKYYIQNKHLINETPILINKKPILINLSNHPTKDWTDAQLAKTLEEYDKIEDIPFPQIDPTISTEEIKELAISYIKKIDKLQPCTVHIMGEMTFTYNIVKMLKEIGIKCIASTTDRVYDVNNNVETSLFKFIGFREY